MTEIELTQQRDLAWNETEKLQFAIRKQAELYLVIGEILKRIRDEKLYSYLGEGGYDTFQHFLNNAEIGLRPSTAYLYIRIYEYYIQQLSMTHEQIIQIPINRLMRLLPTLKTKPDNESKEIVQNISQLTNYDFDEEIKEKKMETPKPLLFKDKETGKYIFQFNPEQVLRIINSETGETIYGELIQQKNI